MLEFSSISVSSYDAASLADQLTAKSADGWEVVAIVPAGTNVTAYLSREAGVATHTAAATDTDAPDEEIAFSFGGETPASTPEATAAAAALDDGAVQEPAGWGTAPVDSGGTSDASGGSDGASQADHGSDAGESATAGVTSPSSTVDVAPATESAGAEPWSGGVTASQAQEPASQQPAQEHAAQQDTAAAAPAGWYADPAGRYELRYWDGAQWTEHVSRAGQQYTDPPVA